MSFTCCSYVTNKMAQLAFMIILSKSGVYQQNLQNIIPQKIPTIRRVLVLKFTIVYVFVLMLADKF